MESNYLIILGIILLLLIILNHLSIVIIPSKNSEEQQISQQFGYVQTKANCSNVPGCCSLTQYGCCPDGVNSRIDYQGTNCPVTYNPGSNPVYSENTSVPNANVVQRNVIQNNTALPNPTPQNIIRPLEPNDNFNNPPLRR